MDFISLAFPQEEDSGPCWWFAFRGDKLLVKVVDGQDAIPYTGDLSELDVIPERKLFLGKLDGSPCYSVELNDGNAVPEGMAFRGLRELFGIMEEDLLWIAGRANHLINWDRKHRFCGCCGGVTREKEDERAKICPACGITNYPRISPAIIVAVCKGDEILLGRSSRFPTGFFSVLAGFVEPGETLEECVSREVKEESGISVKNIRYFGSQPWPFPDSLMIGFTAEYDHGEIVVDNSEILDAGWFSAERLPRIPGTISIAGRLIEWFIEQQGVTGGSS